MRRIEHSLLFLAALLGLLGTSISAQPRLRLHLVENGTSLPPRLAAAALEEVKRIWSPYGVEVDGVDRDDPMEAATIRLDVLYKDAPAVVETNAALGAIRFREDDPERSIAIYPQVIARLVASTAPPGLRYREWPKALREVILGRALGRALAHEIGHFLLRSRNHSPKGLMRSSIPVPDFVAADRRSFMLSEEDAARLEQRFTRPRGVSSAGE